MMAAGEFNDGDTIAVVGEGGSVFYLDVPVSKPNAAGDETNYLREIFDAKFAKGSLRLASADELAELRAREDVGSKPSARGRAKDAADPSNAVDGK